MNAIEAVGLRKSFGGRPAVRGVDLAVGRGELFGLVGPDGAGKTTTLRMLAGLILPDAGTAAICGFDVIRHPEEARPHLGYMAQRFSLYGELTVEENYRFLAEVYGMGRAEREARLRDLLELTGLAPFRRRLADQLSGGMKQKLALGCALIYRPDVLLLDEPTTGVDPLSRREFWGILTGLGVAGITVLVTTPYMDEAERCGRLAFIRDGTILRRGSPDELKAALPGVVFEVRADPLLTARRVIDDSGLAMATVVYGNYLHVVLGRPETAGDLRDRLTSAGVRVGRLVPVPPALEDVFVHLAQTGGEAA